MRYLKLLLMAGAVLAFAVPASAVSIPFTQQWNGPTYWHITDLTMGAVYDPSNQQTDVWLPAAGVPVLVPPAGGEPNESGWTILRVSNIYKGAVVGPNTIDGIDMANPLYTEGYAGKETVGLIYDRGDLFVKFNSADGSQDYLFAGDIADLYVQPVGTFAAETRIFLGLPADGSGDPTTGIWGAAGSSGRLNLADYVGIGHDAAGNPIPNTLSLTLNSEAGYFPPEFDGFGNLLPSAGAAFDPVEGRAMFLYNAATGSGSGDSDIYYSVVGGQEPYWHNWDTNTFVPERFLTGVFNNADIRVHVTTAPVTQAGTYDWVAQSSDPTTGFIVPEPVTMAGMLLGIGCLTRYVRRRRSR